jgi:hypothetical protein
MRRMERGRPGRVEAVQKLDSQHHRPTINDVRSYIILLRAVISISSLVSDSITYIQMSNNMYLNTMS